jgi:hypothetical protein
VHGVAMVFMKMVLCQRKMSQLIYYNAKLSSTWKRIS